MSAKTHLKLRAERVLRDEIEENEKESIVFKSNDDLNSCDPSEVSNSQ
jgi:hypothetical protein